MVTPEMIRAALDSLASKAGGCPGLTPVDACDDTQCGCRDEMQAALTAALAVAPAQGVGNVRGMQNCAREIATLVDEYDPSNSDWSFRKAIIREMLARILSALEPEPAPVLPDGWRLVPVEPTEDQVEAMRTAFRSVRPSGACGMTVENQFRAEFAREFAAYHASLAAAPQPAKEEG